MAPITRSAAAAIESATAVALARLAAANTTIDRRNAYATARRWVMGMQRMGPLRDAAHDGVVFTPLEGDIMVRLFVATFEDPRVGVDLGDFETVDRWMSCIAIYVIKYFGVAFSPNDEAVCWWLSTSAFPEASWEERIDTEIITINLVSAAAAALHQSIE
jgi:hypothetical protein